MLPPHEERCMNCSKHVRDHYGGTDYRCQPQPVESSAMGDNQSIFSSTAIVTSQAPMSSSQPVFADTSAVSFGHETKGVRNYPIVEGQSSAIQMFGIAPGSNHYLPPAVSGSLPRPIDPINPRHYRGDLVMRIIEQFGLADNFYLGNVIKYILRHADKAGIEDLKKARWYLDRMIEREEGKHTKGVE